MTATFGNFTFEFSDDKTVDAELCSTVCRAASVQGWRIKERRSGTGHAFTWRTRDGAQHKAQAAFDRRTALTNACRLALPLLSQS